MCWLQGWGAWYVPRLVLSDDAKVTVLNFLKGDLAHNTLGHVMQIFKKKRFASKCKEDVKVKI